MSLVAEKVYVKVIIKVQIGDYLNAKVLNAYCNYHSGFVAETYHVFKRYFQCELIY